MLQQVDIAIAFTVVMLMLSLLITVLVQVFNSLFDMRGRSLAWGLTKLLHQISFQFLPSFAAIHRDSHDTYMPPLCYLRNRCDVELFTPVDCLPPRNYSLKRPILDAVGRENGPQLGFWTRRFGSRVCAVGWLRGAAMHRSG